MSATVTPMKTFGRVLDASIGAVAASTSQEAEPYAARLAVIFEDQEMETPGSTKGNLELWQGVVLQVACPPLTSGLERFTDLLSRASARNALTRPEPKPVWRQPILDGGVSLTDVLKSFSDLLSSRNADHVYTHSRPAAVFIASEVDVPTIVRAGALGLFESHAFMNFLSTAAQCGDSTITDALWEACDDEFGAFASPQMQIPWRWALAQSEIFPVNAETEVDAAEPPINQFDSLLEHDAGFLHEETINPRSTLRRARNDIPSDLDGTPGASTTNGFELFAWRVLASDLTQEQLRMANALLEIYRWQIAELTSRVDVDTVNELAEILVATLQGIKIEVVPQMEHVVAAFNANLAEYRAGGGNAVL